VGFGPREPVPVQDTAEPKLGIDGRPHRGCLQVRELSARVESVGDDFCNDRRAIPTPAMLRRRRDAVDAHQLLKGAADARRDRFAVDFGQDGSYLGDSTGIQFKVTQMQ